MLTRQLGQAGLRVSAVGLGCMGMSAFYGASDQDEAIATIHRSLELGINFIDTADVYNDNEELVGRALRGRRQEVVLATKFGHVYRKRADGTVIHLDGSADYVKTACETSLRRLGVETIDLYYLHRPDPAIPIEETVGAMADLVQAGKIRYIGLSEASPATIRRAAAVHPVSALQTEYSLWTRDVEAEILPTCRELGIGFVAYSPLGRGFLAGRFKELSQLDADDWRHAVPRFQGANLAYNRRLLEQLEEIARSKNVSSAQLALAWVLAQGSEVVPIPGTRRRTYLEENAGAVEIELNSAEIQVLNNIFEGQVQGERYPDYAMQWVDKS
jgi:aryl-alcohol dehydrogenase-like predicted oxidoreductase